MRKMRKISLILLIAMMFNIPIYAETKYTVIKEKNKKVTKEIDSLKDSYKYNIELLKNTYKAVNDELTISKELLDNLEEVILDYEENITLSENDEMFIDEDSNLYKEELDIDKDGKITKKEVLTAEEEGIEIDEEIISIFEFDSEVMGEIDQDLQDLKEKYDAYVQQLNAIQKEMKGIVKPKEIDFNKLTVYKKSNNKDKIKILKNEISKLNKTSSKLYNIQTKLKRMNKDINNIIDEYMYLSEEDMIDTDVIEVDE